MQINSRTYLNLILTVIAVLLLGLVIQAPGLLSPGAPAYAQEKNVQQQRYISQTTAGEGSAAATEKVATANQEIARQIGEVAKAINNLSKAVDNFSVSQRQAR